MLERDLNNALIKLFNFENMLNVYCVKRGMQKNSAGFALLYLVFTDCVVVFQVVAKARFAVKAERVTAE